MTAKITGGINIALKVPPHQYEATIAFYRDVVGLKPFTANFPSPSRTSPRPVSCGAMPSNLWAKAFAAAGSATRPASFTWCANLTPGERHDELESNSRPALPECPKYRSRGQANQPAWLTDHADPG